MTLPQPTVTALPDQTKILQICHSEERSDMGISRYHVNWRTLYRNIVLEIATACGLVMTSGGVVRRCCRYRWQGSLHSGRVKNPSLRL